jgi:uncharacterized delta-60 repeat protein
MQFIGKSRRMKSANDRRQSRYNACYGYSRRLRTELLEDRRMLSTTTTYSNGSDLTVDASSGTRSVTVNVGNIPSGSNIQDVNVRVEFTKVNEGADDEAFPNEIVYRLTSPAGTTVNLINGGTYDNNGVGSVSANVLFDQSASNVVGSTSSGNPVSGTFRPVGNLNSFNNQNPIGAWTLFFQDTVGLDELNHRNFVLTLTTDAAPATPTDTNATANVVTEGAPNGTSARITISAPDPDGDSVSYSLTNNAGGRFAINSSSGVVTVANSSLINFETASSHEITVQASDGIRTSSGSFTITIANALPAATVDANSQANEVSEGAANGTVVGITASSTDTNGPAVSYSLIDDAGGRFGIHPTTGVVTVANSALIDGPASHDITVQASDGAGGTSSTSFSISVLNVAPALTIAGATSVNEGSVYTLNLSSSDSGADTISQWFIDWGDGSDPDNDSVVGQIVPGNPNSVVHVYADGTRSHTIRAKATDEDGTYDANALGANAIASLDPTFGQAGVIKHDFFGSTSDFVRDSVLVQPDGKILVVGYIQGGITRIGMARYNANGTPDLTFGTNGQGITEFDLHQTAESVVLDSSGRILVAGSDGIARYTSDGALDTSFGIGGLNNTFTNLNHIVLDASGKIVVSDSNQLIRLLNNGTVDGSFDSDGRVQIQNMSVQEFVIDGSGNHIVAGYMHNGTNWDIAVRRYSALGQLDVGYATGGTALFNFGGQNGDFGRAIALHGSGVVVAGQAQGTFTTGPGWSFYDQVVIKLDSAGQPDASFGVNGVARHGLNTPLAFGDVTTIKVDGQDRVVVGGSNRVARYTSTGALDASFDVDGVMTSVAGLQIISSVNLDNNSNILVGGSRFNAANSTSGWDYAVARLLVGNGAVDVSFGGGGADGNGIVSTDFRGSKSDSVRDLVHVLPDGKILAVGTSSGGSDDILLARFLADGTLDSTFAAGDGDGIDGFAVTDFGSSETAQGMAVDSQGRIYVAFNGIIIRYSSNGIRDTSFGTSNGRAFTSLNWIASLAVDANDRVVAGGYRFQSSYDFTATRLLATGAVDSTFGTSGIATADLGTTAAVRSDDIAQAMVLDAAGRIVMTGYRQRIDVATNNSLGNNAVTLRFTANGALDGSFGSGGVIESNLGFNSTGQALAVDDSGRIVVSASNRLLRFTASGAPDPMFGVAGIATTSVFANRIVIDQNGKIVTSGGNAIARYNDNGSPDSTFAPGGFISSVQGSTQALGIDSADRIVVGGSSFTTSSSGADFFLARYLTSGLSVTVQNLPPQIVTLTGPTTGFEGTPINLAVTATDPAGAADPLTYSWSITRNGSPYQLASGASITVLPVDNGAYVAAVTVNDGDGGIVSRNHSFSVSNIAPTGAFNAPASVDEGDAIFVSITSPSDPSATDTTVGFLYAFDFGSGYGPFSATSTASVTTTDNGNRTVRGKIRDKDGAETEYSAIVTVNNVAPELASVSVDSSVINEDGSVTLTGYIIDPGAADTFTLDVNWGDAFSPGVNESYAFGTTPINTSATSWLPASSSSLVLLTATGVVTGDAGSIASGSSFSVEILFDVSQSNPGDPDTQNYVYQSARITAGTESTDFGSGTFSIDNDGSFVGDHVIFHSGPFSLGGLTFGHGRLLELIDNPSGAISSADLPFNGDLDAYSHERAIFFADGVDLWAEMSSMTMTPVGKFSITHQYLDDNPTGTGSDQYQVSATVADDDGGMSGAAVTTITVNNVDPVAAAHSISTDEDSAAAPFNVLAGVSDQGTLDTHTAVIASGTTAGGGTYTVAADGTATYDPNGAFESLADGEVALDSFSYTAVDDDGGTSTATVTVTITGVNDAPVAQDDVATTNEDSPISVAALGVLANDTDVDATDTLSVVSVNSLGTIGLVSVSPDGSFIYNPNGQFESLAAGQTATDTFTYTISDGTASSTATVTVTITGVNDPPIADAFPDGTTTVFSDGTFDLSNWTISTLPFGNGGTVSQVEQSSDGNLGDYLEITTSPAGRPGGVGTFSRVIGVFLNNSAVYDPSLQGEITALDYSEDYRFISSQVIPTPHNGQLMRPVLMQGGDIFLGPQKFFSGTSAPTPWMAVGWTGLDANDFGLWTNEAVHPDFSPAGGEITFGFSRVNTASGVNSYSITAAIDNWRVEVVNLSTSTYVVDEAGVLTLDGSESTDVDDGIVQYEWDLDYDGVTFNADVTSGTPITTHIVGDDFSGAIALRVTDAGGLTDIDTAQLLVNNVAPTITDVSLSAASIDESQSVTVSGTFTDPALGLSTETFTGTAVWSDGATTVVTISGGGFSTSRTFADDDPTGTLADVFTVQITISDDDGGSDSATSPTLTVNNLDAVANAGDDQTVNEGDLVTLVGAFTDVGLDDSHQQQWSVVASNGQVIAPLIIPDGGDSNGAGGSSFSFTPNDNGVYTVTYTVTDDDGGVTSDTLVVTVANVAPAVIAGDDQAADEGSTVSFLGSFTDAGSGDTHTTLWDFGDGATADGTLTPNHVYADNGVYMVTFTVTDDDGGVTSDTLVVIVANVAPTARANSYVTTQAVSVSGNVITDDTGSGVDSDPAGINDPLLITSHTNPANGVLALSADGSFLYTPDSTFAGVDSFTYTIVDGDGGFHTATVSINVAAAPAGSILTIVDTCLGGTALLITGTSGNDVINVEPGSSAATLTVVVNGVATTVAKPTGRIIAMGGAGDDTIHLAGAIGNQAWLYGDAGDDRINNGNGGGLLIGGDGNDQLTGGGGRDIMIGGQGADKLIGNSDDDILVAGYTSKDARNSANHGEFWCDVVHEWNSSQSFVQRVANLRGVLLPEVIDDAFADDIDFLNGASGDDWLIFSAGEDKVAGKIEAGN